MIKYTSEKETCDYCGLNARDYSRNFKNNKYTDNPIIHEGLYDTAGQKQCCQSCFDRVHEQRSRKYQGKCS